MLDELPMIYSSLIMTYSVLEHETVKPKYDHAMIYADLGLNSLDIQRYPYLPWLLTLHGLVATVFVASPAIAPDYASPLMQFISFHISFALLEFFLMYKATMLWMKEKDPRIRSIHRDGVLFWCGGLVCWLLDYLGCEWLWEGEDSVRHWYLSWTVSVPADLVGWLTGSQVAMTDWSVTVPNPQLHAWWHVCAVRILYYALHQHHLLIES